MVCTFFGHRDTTDKIEMKLRSLLKDLIENYNANTFYVGNQGNFDSIVRKTIISLQKDYPHIKYSVVLAYLPVNNNDVIGDTIFPQGIEQVPLKYAIVYRNRWLVDHSDIVITCVKYSWGGAAKFKRIAEKKGKKVINIV